MKIFTGTSCPELAEQVCSKLREKNENITLGDLKIERFLDGEILPLFKESVRDEDIFFIQSINSSDIIMETLLIVDAAKRAGCESFTLVAPYVSYSRQDKVDHLRSSIGSKLMADILTKAGITRFMTIDLHNTSISAFYDINVIHLNGNKIFIDYIKQNKIDDLCIVSPDAGAIKKCSDFCKCFPDATFALVNKKRIKPNEVHSVELVGDVKDKNVIIVDDMADTCNTLIKVSKLIMDSGAKSVSAIATHGIFSSNANDNIDNSVLSEILVSDSIVYNDNKSISSKIKYVSCDELIAKSIWGLIHKKSISELNKI